MTAGRSHAVAGIERLEGVWNIVPTPFRDDGSLDESSLPAPDHVRGRLRASTA